MENRKKNVKTTPPSTPQGPESNDNLVSPEYRNGPYPGDRDDKPAGEGSTVGTHHTGIPEPGRTAEKDEPSDTRSTSPKPKAAGS